jgi:hypothetical protein
MKPRIEPTWGRYMAPLDSRRRRNTMLRRINRKLDKWAEPDADGKTPLRAAFEGAVLALGLLALYSMLGLFD